MMLVDMPVDDLDSSSRLESLREVHRAHEAEHRRMQLDMESAKASSELLERGSSDEQHKFYTGMRVYVQNLTECLTEKVGCHSEPS